MAVSPLKLIREFFGMNLTEMKDEYAKGAKFPLTEKDKTQLIAGLTPDPETGVPSFTY